jgi:phosphoribosylformylglycinamidine cyclo-ligase
VGDVEPGDAIVFLASSGVHTNGLTLCRALADRLPRGYLTEIGDGRIFGEVLLEPSVIYTRFVKALGEAGIRPRYLVHVTGHGWRKLMRLEKPLRYVIADPHPRGGPPAAFAFITQHGGLKLREAYGTFNMGVGFAAMLRANQADAAVAKAREAGYEAWIAGTVEEGERSVEVAPLGLMFSGAELQVR